MFQKVVLLVTLLDVSYGYPLYLTTPRLSINMYYKCYIAYQKFLQQSEVQRNLSEWPYC